VPAALVRPAFVGRKDELAALVECLEGACQGSGSLVLLAGEPGIGKTRLAEELAVRAAATGVRVLWGRCYEGDGAPAFWPWAQILRSYTRECDPTTLREEMGAGVSDIAQIVPQIRDLLPDLAPTATPDSAQARFRVFDAVTAFLRRVAARRPLLLILDDLHWADTPSLLLLRFLARELGDARLLGIGTYRDTEVDRVHPLTEALGQLTREPATRRLALRGLAEADIAHVVAHVAGFTPVPEIVTALHEQTEGNPFFITEVVRLMAADHRLRPGGAASQQPVIPPSVREAIGLRLSRLSAGCTRALTVAAVLIERGRPDDRPRALELAEQALATARALAMRHLAQRMETLTSAVELRMRRVYPDGLTPREIEVLRLLASGMSNKEIAESLVVTLNTVEHHLVSIYGKIGARGRAAATAYALRRQLA
jgi:predicted ATPase/DNA-binding CsgD family transcriptional regulator